MEKIDYKKKLKHLYRSSSKKVVSVVVPKMNFLVADGEGEPGSQSFQDAIAALYPLAYTLKFMIKKGEIGIDYGVLPLEGLWWADDMSSFTTGKKDKWKWTLMIMQPEFVTNEIVQKAIVQVKIKKNPIS